MSERVNVVIPTIGESVNEGTIGKWYFNEGDLVAKDQNLFELDSDKATMEVPASASGKLSILVPAGKSAAVGATVATIEVNGQAQAISPPVGPVKASDAATAKSEPSAPGASAPLDERVLKTLGPSKRKMVREGIWSPPSGQNPFWDDSAQGLERSPMSSLRKRIAERLLESQRTTATLTTFNEIDMSAVIHARQSRQVDFQKTYGAKLGFMSFFSKAVIEALKVYPLLNSRIEGDDIVSPSYVNLGIAVSTERGLIVPVMKAAQTMTFGNLELKIADLAERARTQKLAIPELSGGTFTITNGGIFGSLLSTPIINPPQSGILGMHKIEHRPKAIERANGDYAVEVRPMMYVALSYDHRLIDGATSVGFLVAVKAYLESIKPEDVT